MAFTDWNNNGKYDIEDEIIEYELYCEATKEKEQKNYSPNSGECSGFLAFLLAISGLVIQALFFAVLGIEAADVPGIVVFILWVVIDVIVVAVTMH